MQGSNETRALGGMMDGAPSLAARLRRVPGLLRDRLEARHPLEAIAGLAGLLYRKARKQGFDVPPERRTPAIDVVIPAAPKEFQMLGPVLESLRHLRHPIADIYLIAPQRCILDPASCPTGAQEAPGSSRLDEFCRRRGATLVDEVSTLGYGPTEIGWHVEGRDRSGWLFQQLLKLAAHRVTRRRYYFVLDADTVLIRPHRWIEDGGVVFLQSEEFNRYYFEAFEQVFGYDAPARVSCVSHMMLFDAERVREMHQEIEQRHQKPWDRVWVEVGTVSHTASSVSEFELYANWMLHRYPEEVHLRPLYNRTLPRSEPTSLSRLEARYGSDYQSLSFHHYASDPGDLERPGAVPKTRRQDDRSSARRRG